MFASKLTFRYFLWPAEAPRSDNKEVRVGDKCVFLCDLHVGPAEPDMTMWQRPTEDVIDNIVITHGYNIVSMIPGSVTSWEPEQSIIIPGWCIVGLFARADELLNFAKAEKIDLTEFMQKIELELITLALRKAKGNQGKAAAFLSIPRTTLQSKLTRIPAEWVLAAVEGKEPLLP